MWMTELPPFVLFFVAALLVPLTRGPLRAVIMAAAPLLGGLHLWFAVPDGALYTLSLLDAVPEMRLAGDFSHYIVDREFKLPLEPWERGLIQRCIQRCDSFQGRVASRQQVQLQIDFPQHQKWLDLFKDFWRAGLTDWRARNTSGDLVFLCELGPPEYAMTGPDGQEMSSRWDEALKIKDIVQGFWAEMESA